MQSTTLNVPEIHCGHCKESIESAVGEVVGVDGVEVLVEKRSVNIDYDGQDDTHAAIVAAIEGQGYQVES
jgi:copper chaperone